MFLVLILISLESPEFNYCVIDQCNNQTCLLEAPKGWVEIDKNPDYYEGKIIECPIKVVNN